MISYQYSIIFLIILIFFSACGDTKEPGVSFVIEIEEPVYKYEPADNGANPMWCHGNTCIVRFNDDVFASGLETIENAKPRSNLRWMFFRRDDSEWHLIAKDTLERTREPSPLGLLADGRLFLSANPSRTPIDAYDGPAEPQLLQFSAQNPEKSFQILYPKWQGKPDFRPHSYRSFAVDGSNREMVLFQNIGYTHAAWTFYDKEGKWSKQGELHWPWGAEYEKPQPIRVCYPAVQLRNRSVHFLGVSDIVEPNKIWREYKFNLTGQKWDYDFRRLFYTFTSDITTDEFSPWIEISSREKTAGHIFPCDLWLAPDGLVHILWTERTLDERLQEKFFPEEKQVHALNYAVIKDGKVIIRKPILTAEKGSSELLPGRGRFHITADNRLFVFYHATPQNKDIKSRGDNYLVEIKGTDSLGHPEKVDLQVPLSSFFTASVRGGTAPSDIIDIFGDDGDHTMRYVQIRIQR